MSIVTKLEGDDLKINIIDLLDSLSGEQELQLIEQLSCSDTIIKHVSDQIIHGLTDSGYSGVTNCDAGTSTALSIAIRAIAKSSGDLAKKEIKSLEKSLLSSQKHANEYMDKYYKLKDGVLS